MDTQRIHNFYRAVLSILTEDTSLPYQAVNLVKLIETTVDTAYDNVNPTSLEELVRDSITIRNYFSEPALKYHSALIQSVKHVRRLTSCGLKDGKEAVESVYPPEV